MILKFRKDAIKRKNIVNRYRLLVSMQGGTGNKRCIIIIIVISAFKDLVQGDYIFLVRKKKKKITYQLSTSLSLHESQPAYILL